MRDGGVRDKGGKDGGVRSEGWRNEGWRSEGWRSEDEGVTRVRDGEVRVAEHTNNYTQK